MTPPENTQVTSSSTISLTQLLKTWTEFLKHDRTKDEADKTLSIIRTVDVGEVEKQRWNGCPTGDGRVEGSFVDT